MATTNINRPFSGNSLWIENVDGVDPYPWITLLGDLVDNNSALNLTPNTGAIAVTGNWDTTLTPNAGALQITTVASVTPATGALALMGYQPSAPSVPSAYELVGVGAPTRAYNQALTPAIPSGVVAGDLLILQSQIYIGNPTASSLSGAADPRTQGWTLLGPTSASGVAGLGVWARIATGSDTVSVNWGPVNADACAWVIAYSGNPATLTGIIHAQSQKQNNEVGGVGYADLTITIAGCLVLLCASKNNTSGAAQSAQWNAVSGNGTFAIDQAVVENKFSNGDISAVTNRQIQTTATNITSAGQSLTANDSSTQGYSTVSLALLPQMAVAITPNTGSITLTGIAPSIAAGGGGGTSLTPGAGSITLTGQTPVELNPLIPATGSIALNGLAPTDGLGVIPNAGALSILGQQGPQSNRGTSPGSATLTLTGVAPRFDQDLTPGAATIVLTGQSPLSNDTHLQPATGSISLSGNSPGFIWVLTPGAGALALNSQAGSFGLTLVPAAAAVTLAGGTSTFNIGLSPASGTLTIIGNTSTMTIVGPVNLVPVCGALTLVGYSPWNSGSSPEMQPNTGTIIITTFGLTASLTPGAGSLALTGYAPSTKPVTVRTPNTGVILMETIGLSRSFSPNTGSLTVVGGSPLDVATFLPGTGSLSLAGNPPVQTLTEPPPPTANLQIVGYVSQLTQNSFAFFRTPPSGTIAVNGQGLGPLKLGITPPIPIPDVSYVGNAPTALVNNNRLQNSGTVLIAGQAPVLSGSVLPSPPPAILTITGYAPSLYKADVPQSASVAINGNAPSITINYRLTPPSAAVALTGQAPTTFSVQTILPQTGALAVAGAAGPALGGSFIVSPLTGAVSIAGNIPALNGAIVISANTGPVNLAGAAPLVGGSFKVAPSTGTISVVGNAPAPLTAATNLTPGTGALGIFGQSSIFDQTLPPATASLAITGNAPVIAHLHNAMPATGAIAMSSAAPTFDTGLVPGTGSLSVAGYAPMWAGTYNGQFTPATATMYVGGNSSLIFGLFQGKSVREEILEYLTNYLSAVTGISFTRSRVAPAAPPRAIVGVLRPDDEETELRATRQILRQLTVTLTLVARADIPDQQADSAIVSVNQAILQDPTLGGLAALTTEEGVKWDFEVAAPTAVLIEMRYKIRYSTNVSNQGLFA